MNENVELMMPIKAAPYEHQKQAFAFAMNVFGAIRNGEFGSKQKEGDDSISVNKGSYGCALLMEM